MTTRTLLLSLAAGLARRLWTLATRKTSPAPADLGDVSDGYHTFNELYAHRAALTAALVASGAAPCWRTRHHHPADDPMFPGQFLLGIDLPTGDVRYHYPLDRWDDFPAAYVRDHAPRWDGAPPDATVARLLAWATSTRYGRG